MNSEHNNQEIDVTKLINSFLKFVKQNKIIVGVLTLFGVVFGIYNFSTNPKHSLRVFEKTVVISSPVVKTEIIEDVANSIHLKVKNKQAEDIADLAKKMNVSQSIVKDMVGLTSKKQASDGINYWLTIETTNKSTINEVVNGITNYLNANEYVKLNQDLVNKQRRDLIVEIEKQMKSLQTELGINHLTNLDNLHRSNNSKYFSYIDLFEGKQRIEKELVLEGDIKTIDFNNPLQPKSKLASYLMIVGYGFAGFIISILIAIIIKIVKK
ncbi:MAG: hypothetical protein V4667_13880 [Bacteroidota bacterium]